MYELRILIFPGMAPLAIISSLSFFSKERLIWASSLNIPETLTICPPFISGRTLFSKVFKKSSPSQLIQDDVLNTSFPSLKFEIMTFFELSDIYLSRAVLSTTPAAYSFVISLLLFPKVSECSATANAACPISFLQAKISSMHVINSSLNGSSSAFENAYTILVILSLEPTKIISFPSFFTIDTLSEFSNLIYLYRATFSVIEYGYTVS